MLDVRWPLGSAQGDFGRDRIRPNAAYGSAFSTSSFSTVGVAEKRLVFCCPIACDTWKLRYVLSGVETDMMDGAIS
jgi:hypothetical protein